MTTLTNARYCVIDVSKPDQTPAAFDCKVAAQLAAVALSKSQGNQPVYVTGPGQQEADGKTRYPVLCQASGDRLKSRRGYKANVAIRAPIRSNMTVIHSPPSASPNGAPRPASYCSETVIG